MSATNIVELLYRAICSFGFFSSYFVILLFCYFVILLFCYFVILLFCYFVILLFCYFVILLFCYFVILLFCYFVITYIRGNTTSNIWSVDGGMTLDSHFPS